MKIIIHIYLALRNKPYKLERKAAEEKLRMSKKWQLSLDIMPNIGYIIRMYLAHPVTLAKCIYCAKITQ